MKVAIEDKNEHHHVILEGATPQSCSGALADAAAMLPPRRLVIVVYRSSALENFVKAVSLAHNGLGKGKNAGPGHI